MTNKEQIREWIETYGIGSAAPIAEDLAYRLANSGYQVVLCPVSNLYLDMAYNKNPEEPGQFWGAYVDVDKPFEFIPYDYFKNAKSDKSGRPLDRSIFIGKDRLTEYGQQNILGIEGCLWSEVLHVEGRLDYMLVPKIFGLAERAWAADPAWATEKDETKADTQYQEALNTFLNAVGQRELPRLDQDGLQIQYRIPPPGLRLAEGKVLCNLQLPGFTLRYTTDGTKPTATSPMVHGPIAAKGTIRVAAFNQTGRSSTPSLIENK